MNETLLIWKLEKSIATVKREEDIWIKKLSQHAKKFLKEELQEVFVLDLEPLNDLVGKGETLEMIMNNIDSPKLKFILINNGIDYMTYIEKMFTKEQKREWYQDHVATQLHLVNKLKSLLKNAYLTQDQLNTLARKIEEDFRLNYNEEYEDYSNFKEYVDTFTIDNLKQHLN